MAENNFNDIKDRFEKDATAFSDIYSEDGGFNSLFNRLFRKPIFERFEIAMQEAEDVTGKTILDIGCGPGVYTLSFAARGARLVAIDLADAMLKIAEHRVKEKGLEKLCIFKNLNFLEAPFDQKFDISLAMGVFDYLSDPEPFLRKMKEVTHGKVIISFPAHALIREPLRRLRYLLTGKGDVYFYNKADIEKLVQRVGFAHYQIIPLNTGKGFVLVAKP